MNVECKDREHILREQEPQAMAALERHAAACAECREELRLWNEISAAAPALRKSWASPELWPRIHQAFAEESQRAPQRRAGWLATLWGTGAPQWRVALAGAVLLVVSVVGVTLTLRTLSPRTPMDPGMARKEEQRLLNEKALKEIEQSEAAYIRSIENLAKLAEPRIQQASSPLMLNYREKLLVLDAAIAELRAQLEQNRFNAHLRREMLALYQEKQHTLEGVIREE